MSTLSIERSQWVRLLQHVPAEDCIAVAAAITKDASVQHRSLPQSGLAMLKMVEANEGEYFNLGEIPLASAEVALNYADGTSLLGAAQVMNDNQELATAFAILDAILAHQGPGFEQAETLLHRGLEQVNQEQRIRGGLLHNTTVDFNRLEIHTDDDDEDDE